MSQDDPLKNASTGINIVSEIVKAAGESPAAKEAAQNLGKTAVTITKAINNVLLPIAAVNFAFDKAKTYFEGQFSADFSAKVSNIPPGDFVEPKASIAGPALQGLAFTHEEPSLKEMYLNLLATAMDRRASRDAHPGFVEIIKQLDSEEADLIKGCLRSGAAIPAAQIRLEDVSGGQGYTVLLRHLLHLRDDDTHAVTENTYLPAMIDNWIRLGLVEVSYDKYLTDKSQYSWVESRPEFTRFKEVNKDPKKKVISAEGYIQRTELGRMFSIAIGLNQESA